MKANFALDLSPDGLTLLHRSGSGWTEVGEAALDAPDLGDTLKLMRRTASALETGGLLTKLILPDSHILYTRMPVPGGDAAAQAAAIRAGLEGLTPYAVDELVFDWAPSGDEALVAVVARETLDEAESFAAEHRFNPVCFVAAPEDVRFPGEPWFGLTEAAAELLPEGEVLERDFAEDAPAPAEDAPAATDDGLAAPDGSAPHAEAEPADPTPEPPPVPPRKVPGASTAARAAFATQRAGAAPESALPVAGGARFTLAAGAPPPSPKTDADIVRAGVTAPEVAGLEPAARSRRRAPAATSAPRPAAPVPAAPPPPRNEAEALTVFGARASEATPRRAGAMLSLGLAGVLVLVLVAVAVWLFLPDRSDAPDEALAAVTPEAAVAEPDPAAAPDPLPADAPAPVAEAPLPAPDADPVPDPEPAPVDAPAAAPADTPAPAGPGLEDDAPSTAGPTLHDRLDDLYIASIDPAISSHDAVALPPDGAARDEALPPQPLPPEPGNVFDLDERGLVRPTPEGALSPDGVMVHTGRPEVTPPPRPASQSDAALETAERTRLAGFRPRSRPGGLIERNERATLGGYSRVELAGLRPAARPASAQEAALAARVAEQTAEPALAPDTLAAVEQALEEATEVVSTSPLAIASSRQPDPRPADFSKQVAATRQTAPAVPVSARITPSIPSSASVAKQATVPNAINLGKVNLIGVYGSSSDRRALVRLANGRYVKLQVGDRVDGGRVAAIGDSELRYVKGGRNIVLRMPSG